MSTSQNTTSPRKILAIDFDGTIVDDCFPDVGNLKPGAKEAINDLYDAGFKVIIWTCRSGVNLLKAVEFLAKEGVKYHHINQSCPDNVKLYGCDTRKVYADIYVDDKGLLQLPHWIEIKAMIEQRLI